MEDEMEKARKIELLAEILDVEPEEVKEDMELTEAGEWDSMAILSFIAMMDEEFGKEINGKTVKDLVKVSDALALMEA